MFLRVLYAPWYPLPSSTENSPSETPHSQQLNYLLFNLCFTFIVRARLCVKLGFVYVKYRHTSKPFSMLICAKNVYNLFSLIHVNLPQFALFY